MKRYFFVTLQMDFKRLLYEKVAENSRYYCICSDYYIWVIDMDKCLCGYEIHSRTKWKWLFRRMYVYAYWLIVIWNVAEFCISNIPVYMSLAERRQTIKDWVIFHLQNNHSSDCYFVHKFILLASHYKFNNPAGGEPAVPFQNKLPGTTSSRHIVQVPRYCISPFEHDFYPW